MDETTKLTAQETKILLAIGEGGTRLVIAQEMGISPHTVDSYLRRIYQKLGVKSQASAVLSAVRAGFIS